MRTNTGALRCTMTDWLPVQSKSLINDPTIQLPGMDLPRGQWSLLNRFRSDAGPCRNSIHEWGYIASPLCDRGEHQAMRHIVNECPLTCFDGGISELHLAQGVAFNWLLNQTRDHESKRQQQQHHGDTLSWWHNGEGCLSANPSVQ